MNDDDSSAERSTLSELSRGVRLDLVIAVCALLISSVAAGASWWQARVLVVQTKVLQEQLGAQVWPYLSFSQSIDGDSARLTLANDGLGPAILRSATLTLDGRPQHNYVDMLHAVLGPHVLAREPHGEHIYFGVSDKTPGNVIRPGDSYRQGTGATLRAPLVRARRHPAVLLRDHPREMLADDLAFRAGPGRRLPRDTGRLAARHVLSNPHEAHVLKPTGLTYIRASARLAA